MAASSRAWARSSSSAPAGGEAVDERGEALGGRLGVGFGSLGRDRGGDQLDPGVPALVAERVVRETLTGVALARRFAAVPTRSAH
jgi:hypothetical protein